VFRSRHTIPLIIIALVVSGLTVAGIMLIEWAPERASVQADRYWVLLLFLVAASALIFVIVTTFLIYSVIAFRAKKGDESDGPPNHGNTSLEIAWTVIPTILLAAMGLWAAIVLTQNDQRDSDREVVEVTAQQFAWSFTWRDVELKMRSNDVIHSLYVPEFRLKQDVVPGLTTSLLINANEVGTYPIICAELCGVGHGTMRARAIVLEEDDYQEFLQDSQRDVRRQENSTPATASAATP
jgi:cytochrome c oxidase subunit 2